MPCINHPIPRINHVVIVTIFTFITYSGHYLPRYPKHAYAISTFLPTGYLPVMMITRSQVFQTERGYHAQHETLFIR